MSKISQFYQLSSILTGNTHSTLKANDTHSQCFRQLCHHVNADALDELFEFHQQLMHNNQLLQNKHLVRRQIISSTKFGQIALNIIRLWEGKC